MLEELGRAVAPGPFLPTVFAAAVIQETGTEEQKAQWLPKLAIGSMPAAVVLSDGLVLGGGVARVLVKPKPGGCDVEGDPDLASASSLDPTRRLARMNGGWFGTPDRVRDLAAVLFSAEAAGVAGWCLDTASSYAKVREQFGRPIGQFQAVKHKCADMLIAVEQARAVVWDAARAASDAEAAPLAVAVAASIALDAAADAAKECVQILGGIGFTWEHDAHLYLKRAMAVRQLLGGTALWRRQAAELALAGTRRQLHLDLPAEAERVRTEVGAFVADVKERDRSEWNRRLADDGYLAPHWPRPYGRDAGPVEQLVIDEELANARIRRPNLAVGAWALPTIITHGTTEQQERWVRPTLLGELSWCQMFSEPGAGSDLASLTTKAVRVDGGWSLSGQKVWTSMAQQADWAICLARTDPDAPKHVGITYFILDMRSEGLDIRPLRELTGEAMFNEVFLSDVFVPDDCVVGAVDDGWRLARTTLANERVSMASGSSFGGGVENLLELVASRPDAAADPVVLDRVGALVAEAQSLALLGLRTALRVRSRASTRDRSRACASCWASSTSSGCRSTASTCSAPRPPPPSRATPPCGPTASSPTAASPSPAARARCSATSSPSASWACLGTPDRLGPTAYDNVLPPYLVARTRVQWTDADLWVDGRRSAAGGPSGLSVRAALGRRPTTASDRRAEAGATDATTAITGS